MPTYQTKTTGGTPVTRVATLLESALATSTSGGRGSSSPALLREAHAVVAGEEPYLERNTSELLVPRAHAVPEADVRAVWNDLLEMTETTDWVRLKDEGETQFELGCGMCSGPYEAVVLQNLALLHRSRSVLEIGVFTGTATLALALLPSVEEVVALDIEPYLKREVEPYWDRAGVRAKIDFRIAPALESLSALKAARHEPFDLVFIDADKPSYKAYVQAILDGGLLAEDGVILAVSSSLLLASLRVRSPDGMLTPRANLQDNTLYKVKAQRLRNRFLATDPLLLRGRDIPGSRRAPSRKPLPPEMLGELTMSDLIGPTTRARTKRPRE